MRTMTPNYKRALRPASRILPAAAALIIALGAAAVLSAAEHHDRTMVYVPNAPDGQRAYAVGPPGARVFAIDAVKRTVLENVRGEPRAHGVAVLPNGREVWVANRSGSVSVFDAGALDSLATISTGEYANHAAIHPDGRRAFVTGRDELLVIDTAERVILNRIPTGADPHEIAVSVGHARSEE